MNTLFIEYLVKEEREEKYVAYIKQTLAAYDHVVWLESNEQRRLYLEMWTFQSMEKLVQFRNERAIQPDSFWRRLDSWIVGGQHKLNAWSFTVHAQYNR